MRPSLRLLALAVALLAGCAGGARETSAPAQRQETAEAAEAPAASPEGKSWGGWRWKGKRDDCFFVHANRCYDKQADACRAAGCSQDRCRISGGGPAQISCAK